MAEKRLIDANALAEKVKGICEDSFAFRCFQHSREFAKDIADAVKTEPAVDAVEVVRCKDCKHWLHTGGWMGDCSNGRFHLDGHVDPTMNAYDYCSCGERRTDG